MCHCWLGKTVTILPWFTHAIFLDGKVSKVQEAVTGAFAVCLFVWVKASLCSPGSCLCIPSAGVPGVVRHTLASSDLSYSGAGRDASAVTHSKEVVRCDCTEVLRENYWVCVFLLMLPESVSWSRQWRRDLCPPGIGLHWTMGKKCLRMNCWLSSLQVRQAGSCVSLGKSGIL